jgi:hypothetical protein
VPPVPRQGSAERAAHLPEVMVPHRTTQESTTSVDAPAAADAGVGADASSGPAGIADASEDAGGATPGGIVSFTRGGQSLEVFAVPGQVMLFFRPEATSTDIAQLIEGAGAAYDSPQNPSGIAIWFKCPSGWRGGTLRL